MAEVCAKTSSCLNITLNGLTAERRGARRHGDKVSEARAAKLAQKEVKSRPCHNAGAVGRPKERHGRVTGWVEAVSVVSSIGDCSIECGTVGHKCGFHLQYVNGDMEEQRTRTQEDRIIA